MRKNRLSVLRDYIVQYSKFVFPVVVVGAVAFTVWVGLSSRNPKPQAGPEPSAQPTEERSARPEEGNAVVQWFRNLWPAAKAEAGFMEGASASMLMLISSEPTVAPTEEPLDLTEDVPLEENADEAVDALIRTYFNAKAAGDRGALQALYDEIPDNDLLLAEQLAVYVDSYPVLEIYTKPGFAEGDTIAYVYYKLLLVNREAQFPGCETFYVSTGDEGGLYLKSEKNFTQEETEYFETVSQQADVSDFKNHIQVEYDNLVKENPELQDYLYAVKTQINTAVGVALAAMHVETAAPAMAEGDAAPQADTVSAGAAYGYAAATATVNVRSSDSEQADKIGQVGSGTRVQVQEVLVNGWTKVVYEGKDGYIKSEYLQREENVADLEVIGTVTATATVNVRAAGSTESERLGILAEGETADLLARQDGWCKIVYQGKVGYVKAEYVK